MHGTHVTPTWRPSVENLELVLAMERGSHPKSSATIAVEIGADPINFSAWFCRMKSALAARPHALASMKLVADLRKFETPPASIQPADVARRKLAITRAKALAKIMPIWPNKPVEWTSEDEGNRGKYRDKMVRGDDDDDDSLPRSAKARVTLPKLAAVAETVPAYPLTLAAVMEREASQFSVGDALVQEIGPPAKNGLHDGSASKLADVSAFLAANGVRYGIESLKVLRRVAAAYPPDLRRHHLSWTMHQEAKTPDQLDAIVARLPAGEKLSVDFVKQEVRRITGATPCPNKSRPRGVAGLMARLTNSLKAQAKAVRVAAVVEMMGMLGIELLDISAARLSRAPVVDAPVPAARAVA